jgi:hypothetical protein
MTEALHWWDNILTEHGRSQFPTPYTNSDILHYFESPAEYATLSYDHGDIF